MYTNTVPFVSPILFKTILYFGEYLSNCSSLSNVNNVSLIDSSSIIKENKPFKKIEFKVSNESAWEVGLACGGEIAVYLEQIS